MNLEPNFILIYGGGKVGLQAYNFFQGRKHIIVIDSSPSCLIDKNIDAISIHQFLNYVPKIKQKDEDWIELRVLGDIETLFSIITKLIPQYLIPAAPIHVMVHFIHEYIQQQNLKGLVKYIDPFRKELEIPHDVHHIQHSKSHYLSYMPFDQQCLDSCLGDREFCLTQNLYKSNTITQLVMNQFDQFDLYLFESIQITAGLGGISGESIKQNLEKLEKKIDEFQNQKDSNSIQLIVATTCNCHGVIDGIELTKESCNL